MQKNADGSNSTNTPLYTSINNFFNFLIDTIYYIKKLSMYRTVQNFFSKTPVRNKNYICVLYYEKNYRCTGQAEFFSQKIYQCRIIFIKTPVRIFLLCVYFFLICGLSKRYCAICHTLCIYYSDSMRWENNFF
jgi:hypothetical protein